jgi:hypothetical protein
MQINFEKTCEEALKIMKLPQVPVVEEDYCYYDVNGDCIAMNIQDACSHADLWYSVVEELLPNARDYNLILWALLHEYGHYMDDLSTWNDETDQMLRLMAKSLPDCEQKILAYFHLPSEIVATQWAAEFIERFPELCAKANAMLEPYVE